MINQQTIEKEGNFSTMQIASFYCQNKLFGIPIENVLEVNKIIELTHVPLAPPYIEGVINLRGQIITALNLKKRLGIADGKEDKVKKHHNVIIGSGNSALSLIVDEIGDVLEISPDIIEPPPETIKGMDVRFIKNVCKLKDTLLVVLDPSMIQSLE